MTEFPLLPIPAPKTVQRPPGLRGNAQIQLPTRQRQGQRLQPVFQYLRDVFDNDRDPLTLLRDPAGIAPERALVLGIAGSVDVFYKAVNYVPGLEYLGDEEVEFDADGDFAIPDTRRGREGQVRDDKPVGGRLYLTMPDTNALRQLISLWNRYQAGEDPGRGFGPWFEVFQQLHSMRAWGPVDRIPEETLSYLNDQLTIRPDSPVRLEVELWSYRNTEKQQQAISHFERIVRDSGGNIVHQASIPEIAYEAALIDLPAVAVHRLARREEVSLTICNEAMLVRPQSTAEFPTDVNSLGAGEPIKAATVEESLPIVALFDGVPVQQHRLLKDRILFDDPDGLNDISIASERRHGTEMASLILHRDRNLEESPLGRSIYLRPVLYAPGNGENERLQPDLLLLDTIYRAVL